MTERTTDAESLKESAARAALEFVEDGGRVGLGSGSTVAHFIELIAHRVASGDLASCVFIPSSRQTEHVARSRGLTLDTLDGIPRLDVTIDGADEFTDRLELIKGLGGALLREKILAGASERFIVIVDDSKHVDRLGERAPLPVEVLPFARSFVSTQVRALGGRPALRGGAEPFVTDQGNWILDCEFGPIDDPEALAGVLREVPGVMEHGLFLGMADAVVVGSPDGVRTLPR
ncbi:MAG: ribose-5-phosphate isomerase RpiA [Candidatus Eisenbacteria bacterium]|nr:ribose-5-phosphate isomerase RpiA [Candidatus Eisenbacteria bacterium]